MTTPSPDTPEEGILVLAPIGRDAELAATVLRQAGLLPVPCGSLEALVGRISDRCGAILIAEEALIPSGVPAFVEALSNQPPWSDIPIVLLTSGGGASDASRRAVELLGPHGDITLLERPIRILTLTSALQAALRARRRQFQVRDLLMQREDVLSSIMDAFAMLDHEWRYTYVNAMTCELCRMPEEQMLGRTIWELFPGTVGTELESHLRRAMEERVRVNFEWRNERWERWFSIRAYPCSVGLSLFTVEITERKNMEAVLQESERRLHLALDSAQLGMWYCDLPCDQMVCDRNCKAHLGLPADAELDFPTFYSLLHEDDREPIRLAVERSVHEGVPYNVEYRVPLPGGAIRWIHSIGKAFHDDDGAAHRFDGVTIDITHRKRTELELERAKRDAIEANRAKDQFLAALSHELRTPLNPVLMSVTALEEDPDLPPHIREEVAMIHRQVELEARLIDDLLDLTRIARGKLILQCRVTDLHQSVEHALATCSGGEAKRKNIRMRARLEAREHHGFVDPARFQQIVWNLLNNAVKFTPEGGLVEISTRNPEPDAIEISVSDTGIGIDPETLPRLFDAFEQGGAGVTRRFGGLGLGLAICKAIADRHEGSLYASSPGRGHGAVFTLRLQTVPAPEARGRRPAKPPAALRPCRILLAEDHEPTQRVLVRLLTRAGHRVQAAGTVAEALSLAEENPFDLVVSDLGLPDASGLELMRQLQSRYQLKGVALSGYGMDGDLKASAAAGFGAHLIKPVDWKQLERALARVVTPGAHAQEPGAAG